MKKPLPNRLICGVFLIATTCFAMSQMALANPTCAPFNDPGCFFGENWESSTTAGWAANAPADFSYVASGLNGTGHAAQLHYAGVDQGIWADTSVSHTSANGEIVWIEFWIKYPLGFTWAPGPASVPSMKSFEVELNAPSGCLGRLLLFTWGVGNYTTGSPRWAIYPNISCGGSGQEEIHTDSVGSNFTVTGGNIYHVVNEIKIASGTGGYIKTWYNNQLVLSQSGIQTAPNPALGWQYIRIGGQYGDPGGVQDVQYDQIRMTTTNIAPGSASQPPITPVSLLVK